ncbi:Uncharacterised protein [Vibrio cholerae]|nr:Uncharacterised protein [Vibrio cholerae]
MVSQRQSFHCACGEVLNHQFNRIQNGHRTWRIFVKIITNTRL